jgi:hypothetical protein
MSVDRILAFFLLAITSFGSMVVTTFLGVFGVIVDNPDVSAHTDVQQSIIPTNTKLLLNFLVILILAYFLRI